MSEDGLRETEQGSPGRGADQSTRADAPPAPNGQRHDITCPDIHCPLHTPCPGTELDRLFSASAVAAESWGGATDFRCFAIVPTKI